MTKPDPKMELGQVAKELAEKLDKFNKLIFMILAEHETILEKEEAQNEKIKDAKEVFEKILTEADLIPLKGKGEEHVRNTKILAANGLKKL